MSPVVGDRVVVDVGPVAHGGHCVARASGQVLFVRHALPGETVVAEVTSAGRRRRFLRADAVEVLAASPDRREPRCPVSRACGGCDWQHATPAATRALKSAVVEEAMQRFAGITLPEGFSVTQVEIASAPLPGLGWRTRGTLSVDEAGRAGFLAPRSHQVVVTDSCPQLLPRLAVLDLFSRRWEPRTRVGFVAPSAGDPMAFPADAAPTDPVSERAAGLDWAVAADGFWQVHPGAPDALVEHVSRVLAPRPGDRLVDLYAGVGLFGISLLARQPHLDLTLVEGDRRACELARRNAGGQAVRIVRSDVDRWVQRPRSLDGADLVVLDPPRVGAGEQVVRAVAAARPRAIAYVACDPVALARDVATFGSLGFGIVDLVGLDLFPTTHHVECVAHLAPMDAPGPMIS
ncbi:MAG: methyltransferase [Candidatus Nanopelagicales bacterium]